MKFRPITSRERTTEINRLQKRHPGTRRQRSYHGADKYSVAFFDKTGKLIADYDLPSVAAMQPTNAEKP